LPSRCLVSVLRRVGCVVSDVPRLFWVTLVVLHISWWLSFVLYLKVLGMVWTPLVACGIVEGIYCAMFVDFFVGYRRLGAVASISPFLNLWGVVFVVLLNAVSKLLLKVGFMRTGVKTPLLLILV